MKIKLILMGRTQQGFVNEGFDMYKKRIINYLPFEDIVIASLKNTKNLSPDIFREREGELILKKIEKQDFTILLDEKGNTFNSIDFSRLVQKHMNTGIKNLNFVVGGAYGFSQKIYAQANAKISLSKMTFSHQIIRIIFMEQLYRAMTILHNQPYHNQ